MKKISKSTLNWLGLTVIIVLSIANIVIESSAISAIIIAYLVLVPGRHVMTGMLNEVYKEKKEDEKPPITKISWYVSITMAIGCITCHGYCGWVFSLVKNAIIASLFTTPGHIALLTSAIGVGIVWAIHRSAIAKSKKYIVYGILFIIDRVKSAILLEYTGRMVATALIFYAILAVFAGIIIGVQCWGKNSGKIILPKLPKLLSLFNKK